MKLDGLLSKDELAVARLRINTARSWSSIARTIGVSKQRVHQVLKSIDEKLDSAARAGNADAKNALNALRERASANRNERKTDELCTSPLRRVIISALTRSGMAKSKFAVAVGLPPNQFNSRFLRNMGISTVERMLRVLRLRVTNAKRR